MAEPGNGGKFEKLKLWLTIAALVLGPILATVLGYVSAKSTSAASSATQQQQITSLELKVADQQKQLDYFRDNYAPRAEIKPQLESITRMLERIENNLSAMRTGRSP